MPDVGNDFASVLARAQELPDAKKPGRDLADGFPFAPPSSHQVVDAADEDPRAIPGVVRYSAKVHRRVFTIWRDWSSCSRCKDAIASNLVVIPQEGEYDCPHHNKDEYELVVNDILAGRLIMGSEQELVQPDGSVRISLRWYERLLSKAEKRRIAKAQALATP